MTTQRHGASAGFTAVYDGSALANHAMAVSDLAPALLSLDAAFNRANALLNGNRAQMALNIRGTQAGSFDVVLSLEEVLQQAISFFSSDIITSAANLKTLFFGDDISGLSLLGLMKRSDGGDISLVDEAADADGQVEIEIKRVRIDGIKMKVSKDVAKLAIDPSLRKNLSGVVKPLMKGGFERLLFRDESRDLETVEASEARSFQTNASIDGTIIGESITPLVALQPEMVRFSQGRKWRFTDGSKSNYYDITDTDFEKEVLGGRKFGSDDILLCEVRTVSYIDSSGKLKTNYEITHVKEQRSISQDGYEQLPFTEDVN